MPPAEEDQGEEEGPSQGPAAGPGPGEPEGQPGDWRRRLEELHQEVHALYLACRDPRCPWYARLAGGCVVAYALSPIDLIPDFIPVLGLLDDIVLVPLGLLLVRRLMPAGLMDECRTRAKGAGSHGRLVSWVGGAAIICVWLGLGALALYGVLAWLLSP